MTDASEQKRGSPVERGLASQVPARWRRQLGILIGGYLSVGVFALATIVIGLWEQDLSTAELLAVAALVAAPLALVFVSDRLTSAKVGPVEVSFAEVATKLDLTVADNFQSFDSMAMSDSLPIIDGVIAALRGSAATKILVINLRDGNYWWSTRLFLLAALIDDYTSVEMVVFVEGGAESRYVGIASPSDTRRAVARQFEGYEITYRRALDTTLAGPNNVPVPRRRQPEEEIRELVMYWGVAVNSVLGKAEQEIKAGVGRTELTTWMAAELDTHSVDWDGLPLTAEVRYRIVGQASPFVALTQGERLERVVDRIELSTRISQRALEHVMASGRT